MSAPDGNDVNKSKQYKVRALSCYEVLQLPLLHYRGRLRSHWQGPVQTAAYVDRSRLGAGHMSR